MSSREELVRESLGHEAMRAAPAETTINRLLGQAPKPRPAERPWRWAVVLAAATALMMSSAGEAPRAPTQPAGTQVDRGIGSPTSARQVGRLDLAYRGVHVELAAGHALDQWYGAWHHPCQRSLLTPLAGAIPSQAACSVRLTGPPLWEILVSPRYATVPIQSMRFRWSTPVSRTYASIEPPVTRTAIVSGYPAWVSSATGEVHYPCFRGWVRRIWTSVYFPQQDAQVSILAPNRAGVAWLATHITIG